MKTYIFLVALILLFLPLQAENNVEVNNVEVRHYVPVQEWHKVLEQHPQGVQCTPEQYNEWKQSLTPKKEGEILLEQTVYRSHFQEKTLHIEMEATLHSTIEDIHTYSFHLGNFYPEKALLNDELALLQHTDEKTYCLHLPKQGKYILKIYATCALQTKNQNLITTLQFPSFSNQIFHLQLPVSYECTSSLPMEQQIEDENQVCYTMYVGSHRTMDLSIFPKQQDEKKAISSANIFAAHLFQQNILQSKYVVKIHCMHQAQQQFIFSLPSNTEILHVSEEHWALEKQDTHNTIVLLLEKPLLGHYTFTIQTEQELTTSLTSIPCLEILEPDMYVDTCLSIEKTQELLLQIEKIDQLRQIPITNMPKQYKDSKIFKQEAFVAFQSLHPKYELQIQQKQAEPKVQSNVLSTLYCSEHELEYNCQVHYQVQEGYVKQLNLQLPLTWTLTQYNIYQNNQLISNATVHVQNNIMQIQLPNKIQKKDTATVCLTLRSIPKDWQKYWETADVSLPVIQPLYTNLQPSFTGILLDPSFSATLSNIQNAETIDVHLLHNLNIKSQNLQHGLKLLNEKATAMIQLQRKNSQIAVSPIQYINVHQDKIHVAAILIYDIQNAPQNQLEFTLPNDFAYHVNISDEQNNIQQIQTNTKDDLKTTTVYLHKKILGKYILYIDYQVPFLKNRFIYPCLQFLNINQIKGYIGITGTTNSEITTIASHNIRKLAQHQMPIVFHPNFPMQNHFIQTFQYSNIKVDLTLNIKMHKKITMAQTVIHKADITTVFLHPNKERVVCQYQLTHTQQPYFIFQLPKNANLWSITINEKGQKPIQYKSAISIPLPLQNTPVQIQIIYERTIPPLAICGQRRLESPLLSKKIPILSKNWTVYTPEQYSLDVETESLKEMFLEELSSIDFMYLFFGKYSMRAPTVVEKMVAEDIQDFSRIRPTRPTPPMPSPAPSRSRGRYPQKPMAQAKRQKDRFDQMMSQPKIEEYDDEDNSVDEMMDDEDDSVDEIEYESMPQEAEEMYEEEAKEMPKQKSIWERPKGLEQQLGYAKRSKSYSKKQEGVFTETGKMKKYPAPKKWKPQDTTVTSTVKAAGLLSLNISLSDKGTKKIYREIPPQRSTHTITYIHTTLHQVICAAILSLSTLLSLCVMCQKRFPRLPWILFFLSIAFLFPYNPQYIAYLNSWAYGIFLAIGFRFIFVVWKKLFTLKNNAVICLFLILFSSSAFAQERKMQTMSTVPTSIVPTTISTYVPYYPNSPEITDKTIYIPWEQFTKYNLTRTPIEKSISFQTQYKVDITETQILCQSIFHIQTNKDNDSVFVGLQNSAIQSAYISTEKDKNPLSLQPRKDGYYALIPYKGNYTLDITYTPQGNLQPNQGNCQIHCCTPCLLTVSAPSYTQIHYDNLQDYYYFQTTNTQNTLICHPTQNIVEFYWRPKQHPQDVGNNIQANTRHMLTLQDNTLTLQSNIQYNIASGSVSQLSLEIPKEYGIFELTGTYVEKWTQTPQKDNHQITVLLSNNLQKRIQIQLLAKKHIVNIPSVETFPNILLHNIQRENGQAILKTHNHYQILPKEYSNISKTNSNQEQEYFVETYNFYKKYDLPFQINYQQNNSISKSNLHLQIKEEKLYAIYNANIENKGAPLYSISYSLPAGYQVLNIQGNNIKTTQIQNNLLYITFHTPLQKNSKLNITLEMEQEWNKPIPFELPKIFSPDIQKQTGSILLTTTPQIQIIPQNIQNLISDDTLHYEIQHNLIHRYAYIFEDTNYQANIQIQQQQPILQATQNIHLLLETDWISKSYTIQYQILHAPTNKFQITMPSELNPQIQGHNIQRTTQQTENKKTTHTIYLHTPVQNSYTLTIYPSLQENKESLINIESLELHDTQTLGTTIQVQNQSDYELVVTKLKNLTNMNTNNANIILAYKTQDKDWQLQFSQNRQPTFHPIKATIPNIYIFTILDETNRTYTQITYHLQQTGLQFLELENVPENIWAMYVNFQTVTPIQKITLDNRKIHLIPLQNTSQQIIQVIYTEVHKTKIEPKIPTISNVPEINNLYWTISLPNTKKYTFQSNLNPISYATNFNPASYFASISSQNIEQLQIIPESQNIKNIENAILQQNRIQLQQSIPTHEPEQYGTRNYLDADKIKNTKLHTNILKESYSLETHQQFVQRQYQKQRTSPKSQPTTQTALLQLSAPSSNISYYFTKKQSTPQLTINIHDPNNWLIPVVQIIAFFLLLCISLWKYPKTWKKKFIHLIILGIVLYIVVQYVPLIYYIL